MTARPRRGWVALVSKTAVAVLVLGLLASYRRGWLGGDGLDLHARAGSAAGLADREPNDAESDAVLVPAGSDVYGALRDAGDEGDWFAVPLDPGDPERRIAAELESASGPVSLELRAPGGALL